MYYLIQRPPKKEKLTISIDPELNLEVQNYAEPFRVSETVCIALKQFLIANKKKSPESPKPSKSIGSQGLRQKTPTKEESE